MFMVDPNTKTIRMHRGDTGSLTIRVTGYTYGEDDRAVFTVKSPSGTVVMERVYPLAENAFVVTFANGDTDYLAAGNYKWDVRYVVDPTYVDGKITDGPGVATPRDPSNPERAFDLILYDTVGQI